MMVGEAVAVGERGGGASEAESCEIDWNEALRESREASSASARDFICCCKRAGTMSQLHPGCGVGGSQWDELRVVRTLRIVSLASISSWW